MRRWRRLVAVVAILLGCALLLALAAPFLLDATADRLKTALERRATGLLGAPVTIGSLRLSVLPAGVELRDLRAAVRRAPLPAAEGSIAGVTIRAGLLTLIGWRREAVAVRVVHPEWSVEMPSSAFASAGGAALLPAAFLAQVPPGSSLHVEDGTLVIATRGGGRLRLSGLKAALELAPGGTGLHATMEFADGAAESPARRLDRLSGGASLTAGGPAIRIDKASLRGAGVSVDATVEIQWLARQAAGRVEVVFDLGRAGGWLPAGVGPSGTMDGRLDGTWGPGGLTASGDVRGAGVVLAGVPIESLRGDVRLERGTWRLTGVRADLLGGQATGSADVVRSTAGPHAAFDLRLEKVDVARVLALSGWAGPAIAGTMGYTGRHEIGAGGLATLRGSGRLEAVGRYPSPRGRDLPVSLDLALDTSGSTIQFRDGVLRAGTATGRFSGSFRPGDGVRLKLSGATGDITEILPLFAATTSRARPAASKPKPEPKRPAPPPATPPGGRTRRTAWPGVSARPLAAAYAPVLLAAFLHEAIGPPAPWSAAADRPDPGAAGARSGPDPGGEGPLERIIRTLGGQWEWEGDLHYSERGMSFRGTVRSRGLALGGTDLGDLEAEIEYAGDRLRIGRAHLRREDGGRIELGGEIRFGRQGKVALQATAEGYPLAPVLAAAGIPVPIDGPFSGRLDVGGRPEAPSGHVALTVRPLRVAGLTLDALEGELVFTPEILEARRLVLSQGAGRIEAAGRLPYTGEGEWLPAEGGEPPQVVIKGEGIDLVALFPALAAKGIAGTLGAEGTINGSLLAPRGSLRVRGDDLALRGTAVGPVEIEAALGEGRIEVHGAVPDATVAVEGTIGMSAPYPARLTVVIGGARLPVGRFVPAAPDDTRLEVAGRLVIDGPAADWRALDLSVDLATAALETSGLRLAAREPVHLAVSGGRLRLRPVTFEAPGTEVVLAADMGIAEGEPLEATARGRMDLGVLGLFDRDLQAEGRAEIVIEAGGSRGNPSWKGHIEARAEALRHTVLPYPITDLVLDAVFEKDRIRIAALDFVAGGGPVKGEGEIVLGGSGGILTAGAVRQARIRLTGMDMKTEFPRGLRSTSDLDLTVEWQDGIATVRGSVDLVRAVYSRDFHLDTLTRRGTADLFRVQAAPGAFAGVRLDVELRGAGNLWLRNDFATLEADGDLRLGGTLGRPEVTGRVNALEGGTVQFRGTRYHLLGGSIDFADPQEINPTLDVTAETRIHDYDITLRLYGTLSELRQELTSTPPLDPEEITLMLLTGQTPENLAAGGRGAPDERLSAYLAGGLTGELAGSIGRWAGLDRVSVDPLMVDGQGDPTTRVTLGKQVTPDLFVAYSNDLGSTEESIYQLEYSLTRDFLFSSIRDKDGSVGGDFKYILRARPEMAEVNGGAGATLLNAIRIEGHPHFAEKKIRRRLRVRAGKPRDRGRINAGLERLQQFYRKRGYLLVEIQRSEIAAGPGAVDLVVTIQTGPRVRMEFEGIRDREGLRQELAAAWQSGLPVEIAVAASRDRLLEILRDRAWRLAEVTPELRRSDAEEVHVVFRVERGLKVQAGAVRLEGTRLLEEKRVRRVLKTERDGIFSRGLVRENVLRDDLDAIRSLYLSHGFPAVKIEEPLVEMVEPGDPHAAVTFRITEGPQARVREVRFEGNEAFPAADLIATADIEPGAPYAPEAVEEALVALRRKYDEAGYPDARIEPRPLDVARGDEKLYEDLGFLVREGTRQQVTAIEYRGNVRTRERVLRKTMTLEPGDWVSRRELLASQRRLYQRGIFRSVTVAARAAPAQAEPETREEEAAAPGTPAPPGSETPAPAAPVPATVRVEVREAAPLSQTFGIGYDSEEHLRGLYEITNRNIFGSGRLVSFQARASDLESRFAASYREVGTFGGRYDALASTYVEDEDHPGFEVRRIGGSVRFTRQFSRHSATAYRYSLEDIDTTGDSTSFEESTVRLSSLTFQAIHDTRDALFDPRRGHFLSGEFQFYGEGLGSEAEFTRYTMQAYLFREIAPRVVWAQALRAGAAIPFGTSKEDPMATGDSFSGVPIAERFFAGGDTTVRGFERDRLGPIDPATGDPVGGEAMIVINEELRFPIYRFLNGAFFYDGGNVFVPYGEFDLSDIRHVLGFGLRIATPIGPFRFEYGAILDREPTEAHGQFFFSIGPAF